MKKKIIDMDIAGMIASGICALHCLALPFLFIALPLAGLTFIANIFWEIFFLASAALIGTSTLFRTISLHGKRSPVVIFSFGIFLLVCSKIIFPHSHEIFSFESVFSFFGGITIVSAHVLNYRFRKIIHTCEVHEGLSPAITK